MVDLNELYSPSKWSKRLSADVIVDRHGKIMAESNYYFIRRSIFHVL